MFEEPEAKRVRREDLSDSDHSDITSSGDEAAHSEMRARLSEQIAQSLGLAHFEESASPKRPEQSSKRDAESNHDEEDGAEAGADEFEFQLFSNSAPTTKIVLEDENIGDGALVRGRPESYYFVTGIPEEQKLRYAFAAVSGDQVLERAKVRSWGLELPWRVVRATGTDKLQSSLGLAGASEGGEKSKGRPGKKKRLATKMKVRAAEEKAKLASAKMAEKEEHIKDKKKRLNRAKKLRRRAKAREQKTGDVGAGEDSDDSA